MKGFIMQLNLFPIKLEEAFMLSPKVKHFVFRAVCETPFIYQPGQFITIHFEKDGKKIRRSYSIANAPKGDNRIEFAAGFVENGPGTDLLFNLNVGDKININGPFGRLILKDPLPKRLILMATSTGITPYCAMLPTLEKALIANPEFNVILLQGVQHQTDKLYADILGDFAKKHANFSLRFYLSRENAPNTAQYEHKGYVQHALSDLNLNPDTDLVYLCGNPAMIDETFNILKEHHFETQHVIREKYISN